MGKFDIKNIIISWGEPSLHPDFWRLMVFFYYKINPKIRPALNTNGILFSQEKMLRKLEKLIRISPLPRKQISLSFSNIANPKSPKNKKEWWKSHESKIYFQEIFEIQKYFIYYNNTRKLWASSRYIWVYFKFYKPVKKMMVTTRYSVCFIGARKSRTQKNNGVFLQPDLYEEVMPENFNEALPYIQNFITSCTNFGITISLKNLPICNFNTDIQQLHFSEYSWEKRIGISSFNQMENIDIPGDYFTKERTLINKMESCKNCRKNRECSIEKEYLDIGIFNTFSTIYNEEKGIV